MGESFASFGVAIGSFTSNAISKVLVIPAIFWVWEHRLGTIPLDTLWGVTLLFLGTEFFYYWHHRAAHRIRWFWLSHSVHHSGEYFNLSVAYRLGWFSSLTGAFVLFLPLNWLGFHPLAVGATLGLNLLYQFWIHTELVPFLGWGEWVLNTPKHHRLHHAANPEYIDRNYGGVLIIFDRLFGTLATERPHVPVRYGLTRPVGSYNPFRIAAHEWMLLYEDAQHLSHWGDRLKLLWMPPEWSLSPRMTSVVGDRVKP